MTTNEIHSSDRATAYASAFTTITECREAWETMRCNLQSGGLALVPFMDATMARAHELGGIIHVPAMICDHDVPCLVPCN